MRILGIDPGVATIGFGLVEADRAQVAYGHLRGHHHPGRAASFPAIVPDRSGHGRADREAEAGCDGVEELFFNTNLTTGIAVAHGRGVILCAAERCGVPLHEYTPGQVKLAVTGYGKAEKHQVMDMTKRLLHLKAVPRPDDAADALALALCHARSFTSRLPSNSGVKETI